MKYVILVYSSIDDLALTGQETAEIGTFLEKFNGELKETGEFVDAQGLAEPARRVRLEHGLPVVTDGPYAETAEVLAGYWVVACDSFDRATEIAVRLNSGPGPASVIDVRPLMGDR
jgi:hypothetical protein